MEARLLIGFVLATALVLASTPVAIRVAHHLGFLDVPAGYKGHRRPTPYLGGAAVMVGFLLVAGLLGGDARRSAPVLGGAVLLWALGTLDDRRHVAPGIRAGVELALAAGVWALGYGWSLGLGPVADLVVTCLWVVGVVNAFNLFDNMDGASSTMALVVAGAVAVLGVVEDDGWLVVTGAALSGACLGFLPANLSRPSARIFLGDGGSMPIGFIVATLVMMGAGKALPEFQALLIGLLLVAVPALDTCLVIVSRRRKGISILTGGRDHLTHRTRRRVRSARAVAATLGGIQAVVAALALVAVNGSPAVVIVLVALYVAAAGATIVVLEAQEDQRVVGLAPEAVVAPAGAATRAPRTRRGPGPGDLALLAVLGLGAACSPFRAGYYDAATWVPIGLGVTIVAAALALGRPVRLGRAGSGALVALTALGLLALASRAWAESAEAATVDGDRLLVLAAVLGLALLLLRDERCSLALLGALGAGVLALAGSVLVRLLAGDTTLLLSGRLHEPLGYANAEATVLITGVWLALAAGERRHALVAGAGAAAATLCAGLALMSQSRGAALAMVASTLVVLAVVPGRRRRAFALGLCVLALVALGGPLLEVYDRGNVGTLTDAVVAAGGRALGVAALLAGLLWGACVAAHGAWVRGAATREQTARRAGDVVLVGAAVVATVVALASAGRITDDVRTQYAAFTSVSGPTPAAAEGTAARSRLLSGAGTRYDYWRVAAKAFRDHPLAGLGAGNYDRVYFRERLQAEDVRQPHSLELQVLSELGLLGGALLAALVAALGLGAWRTGRAARTDPAVRAVAVAAVGGTTAWLAHTSVDWMHIVPGVTAIALCLAAMLLRHREDPAAEAAGPAAAGGRPRAREAALAVAIAAVVVVTGASLARQGLAERYRSAAFAALPDRPAAALRDANRALRLDGDAVRSYYARSAALARFGEGRGAEQALREAARREPSDFVTWALLGDLALRRGATTRAAAYYRQARTLNPLGPQVGLPAAGGQGAP